MRSVPTAQLDGPFEQRLRDERRDRWWFFVALIAAAIAHGAFGWMVSHREAPKPLRPQTITSEFIDIDLPPAPPEPPPPDPTAQATPKPIAKTRALRTTNKPVLPETAQAAPIVTRQSDPGEPVDLTGFVAGTATAFAGGTTASSGTSKTPVSSDIDRVGDGKNKGTTGGVSPKDLSSPPSATEDTNWNCPFPLEADVERIRNATTTIRVSVNAADTLVRVDIVQDPGHGFGEAARRCAMGKSWRSARYREGRPTAGSVMVRVQFVR